MFVVMSECLQKTDHTSPNKLNVVFFLSWLFLRGVLKASLSGSTVLDWIPNPFLFTVSEKISPPIILQGSFVALTCDTSLKIRYEDTPIPVLWIYFWKEFMEYSYEKSQRDALFLKFIWQSTLHVSDRSAVYTVLRYSWWWTADLSETCRVLYQINLRNSAPRCLSL